jgi:hypothetical protein
MHGGAVEARKAIAGGAAVRALGLIAGVRLKLASTLR